MGYSSRKIIDEKELIIDQNCRHSVFVLIMSRSKIKITKKIKKEVPRVALILRSDGKFGLPGGGLENKDKDNGTITIKALRNTAVRECIEEIGYHIVDKSNLKFESSILYDEVQVTNFIYFVSDSEMDQLYKSYYNTAGKFYNAEEVFGLNVVQFRDISIYNAILKNNFKISAKIELERLIKKYFD